MERILVEWACLIFLNIIRKVLLRNAPSCFCSRKKNNTSCSLRWYWGFNSGSGPPARQTSTLQMRYIPRSTYSFVLFQNLFKKFNLEFRIPTQSYLGRYSFISHFVTHLSLFFFLEVDVQISGNIYSSMILLFRRVFLLTYLKIDYFHAAFC